MKNFRDPQFLEMCKDGDRRRYLWVMETTLGRIFGKAFVTDALADEETFEKAKLDAYNDMLSRVGRDDSVVPAGSLWEAFL